MLDGRDVDVVFSDISMPGLDGMALARVISRFSVRPQIVFVTAHDEHAVDAFALRGHRLRDEAGAGRAAVRGDPPGRRRADREAAGMPSAPGEPAAPVVEDETIPVELGGVTRFITRSQIRYAQAHGDYARLHTETGSHLVRVPLSVLEERWAEHGFVRIHRSTLVALPHVSEVRMDHGRCSVSSATSSSQVSRRHTKHLRDTLLRRPIGDKRPNGG